MKKVKSAKDLSTLLSTSAWGNKFRFYDSMSLWLTYSRAAINLHVGTNSQLQPALRAAVLQRCHYLKIRIITNHAETMEVELLPKMWKVMAYVEIRTERGQKI